MSSLTGRGERFPSTIRGVHLRSLVPHHFASGGFSADTDGSRGAQPGEERPAPEGAGGSRGDPHRNMCQRADDVPGYKSLPGSVGDRIRSTMSFGGGTLCRGSNAGCGRSDRKVACCEKCSASLVALKKQALSLAVHHHFSCKDFSDLSLYLHDNLRVHGRDREQGECGSCGRTLNQLKQEAIHLALSRGQSLAKPPFEAGLLGHNESKHGERAPGEAAAATAAAHLPRSQTYSPHSPRSPRTPQRTPQTLRRRGAKTPIQDMDRWVEEQQQLVASKYATSTDGVTGYAFHKAADDATQSCGDVGTLQTSSKIPHISRVVNIANTAAMSFLSRAAEKLNLTLRKKGQASHPAPSNLSSCFREIVQKSPPPVPPCLLQAATRTKDSPNVAKVKVVLRVHPAPSEAQCYPSILRIDPSKKRVTVMEPIAKNQPYTAMTLGRDGKSLLKTFNFDAAYPQESSQAEVGAGVLADVIRCVLSGSDGCVLGLGCADVGSWSSMVGSGESVHKLGVMPCAISWLYSAIERRREKTWTDLTVSVSAMELCCGDEDTLRDLLGEVVPSSGGVQDSPKAHVRIQEDPVSGIQLRNHNRVKAPTAERAASLLDAAIAARRHSDFVTYLSHSSVMFFTLHVQPPRTESSTIGKGSRGSTKLTLIDVCSGMRGMSKNKPPHAELGPIVLSLLHGNKTTPSKGSKLTMLLRESLSHSNCHIAVMADVSDSLAHLQETFATIQLASRIRRTQKRTKQSTSCSPCGRSLTREKRGPQPLSLRAFHSTDEVDVDTCPFRLRSELDERSSSDQSCDTVIQIDLDGLIHPKGVPRLTQPEFVPIIPSLHPNKADLEDPEFTALLQELLRIPQLQGEKKTEDTGPGLTDSLNAARKPPERDCLKCDTFAELQERLGCIDGSEITIDLLKSSLQGASYDIVSTKLQHPRDARTQGPAEAPEAAQTLNQGSGCTQASARDKPTDGTFPGDSFQREDSGLYDCEECSANSSSEELLNQTLGLNMACRQEPPHTATSKSGQARHFGMDAARTVSPGAFANHLSEKQENPDGVDWFKPDKRASPIGKSSPISPSSYCTSSHSLAKSVVLSDVLHNRHTQDVKEVKATITVTVQQPLDLKGQDELVFSMVEEVTISGAYERGSTGGNIICIRDAAQSKAQDSTGSQPIRIISNVGEESVAPSSSNTTDSSAQETKATETNTENPKYQSRRERGFVPSFINHMLINTDVESELDGAKAKESLHKTPVGGKSGPEDRRNVDRLQNGRLPEKRSGDLPLDTHRSDKSCCSSNAQVVYNSSIVDDSSLCSKPPKNKMCEKRPQNTGKVHLRDTEHVYAINAPRVPEGGLMVCRHGGSTLRRTGVPPGCLETALASSQTGSLPRGWQNANSGCHVTNAHRASRGVTSSTPCSPGATLERRQGRVHPPANHTLHISSPRKYGSEFKQESSPAPRRGVGSLFETSSLTMKRENAGGRMKSPGEDSGKLFSAKLEQLATRTNSLGRIPRDFPAMERGSSNTSMSSKGSVEGACKPRYKGHNEGECTFPRASRSPRKSHRSDHHFFPSEKPVTHSTRHNHSKLSAVGKLKISTPKVRRLSAPSMKNLSLSHKNLQQSINRSASLSPDGKTISFERTSSFFSSSTSSPPRSFHSVSRTPSQSSTCSSTKSVIQSFVNGRISDLLKERAPSPPSGGGLDHVASLPSPYSQVTAPRMPDRMSGHASDTTSVLSGDLPPAMGKTSLHFSNRSSLVSSGYGSMVRDSEASNRDSVSDRSGSQLSVARSSRSSSRRRGNSGTHQRRPSHDTSASMRRSSSGLRSRWMDRGIPEAYELKVYEIDNLQRMQKRAGADKQGSARFSAKLKLLEHRQQRIAEVRDKYSTLRGALEGAKHHLMLGPTKWNHEFDLWQTFEVDSLEHLEALEGVTARLESRVNRCKANVMMVTCFDAAARRRRKRRSRRAPERRVPEEL